MFRLLRRWVLFFILAVVAFATVAHLLQEPINQTTRSTAVPLFGSALLIPRFKWRNVPQRHPVENLTTLPTGPLGHIPKIQAEFASEMREEKAERQRRLAAVEGAFIHSWEGYKKNAWMADEVAPLSGSSNNDFGGWGATLVDSLDTLWIMGLRKEFDMALAEVRKIDFTTAKLYELNVFETTIRYLGGLLSAYDVSGQQHKILLEKAIELGDMLYCAFDTPNRMPVTRWDWQSAAEGTEQEAESHSTAAEVGSMTLEFTRLSQLTGNPKWYDAISRVTDTLQEQQNQTKIPGLWPIMLDTKTLDFHKGTTFTLGGMADSLYEYFPKQHLMLGGRSDQYRDMYSTALQSAKDHLFFQPLNPNNDQLLIPGTIKRHSAADVELIPQGQHLSCFAGGMVALGAKVFEQTHELETARQLVDGCLWAYESMPSGLMAEIFTAIPCNEAEDRNCTWSDEKWHRAVSNSMHRSEQSESSLESAQRVIMQRNLPPGLIDVPDPRYSLRPEAIESIFILYRITGDKTLQDRAWRMFQAIRNATKTDIAFASVKDVTEKEPQLYDSMESFWTAETLKYFYLIFSEPDVMSLDKYVFNTEAHPLLRPTS
jgi:mannosyl-oligosaccharide alpha-1,2-mannosidase